MFLLSVSSTAEIEVLVQSVRKVALHFILYTLHKFEHYLSLLIVITDKSLSTSYRVSSRLS